MSWHCRHSSPPADPCCPERRRVLQDASSLEPLHLPIYKNMRVVFIRKVRKDVNGMDGGASSPFDPHTQAVEVLTAQASCGLGPTLGA